MRRLINICLFYVLVRLMALAQPVDQSYLSTLVTKVNDQTDLWSEIDTWISGVPAPLRPAVLLRTRSELVGSTNISEEIRWDLLNLIGDKFQELNRNDMSEEAVKTFELSIRLTDDDLNKALSYQRLHGLRTRRGDTNAQKHLDQILALLEHTKSPLFRSKAGSVLGDIYDTTINSLTNIDNQLKLLQKAELQARTNIFLDEHGRLTLLKAVGNAYLKSLELSSNYTDPLRLYEEVRRSTTNDLLKADCIRLIGEISMLRGDHKASTEAAQETIALLSKTTDEALRKHRELFLSSTLNYAAQANQMASNFNISISLRNQLATGLNLTLDPESEISLRLNQARDYKKLSNTVASIAEYDRILSDFPQYGTNDGVVLDLEFERINALPGGLRSTNNLPELESLWIKYQNSNWIQAYSLGNYLLNLYEKAGMTNKYTNLLFVVSPGISKQYNACLDGKGNKRQSEKWGYLYQETLYRQGGACAINQDYSSARRNYDLLISTFPKSSLSKIAIQRIAEIKQLEWRSRKRGIVVLVFVSIAFAIPVILWILKSIKHKVSKL